MLNIRPATVNDLDAITEIYNEAIVNTTATFDTDEKTAEEQLIWFSKHGKNFPIFIAEQDGTIVGWASLSRWSDRCAYDSTAEVSFYVKPEFQGIGIGKKLLKIITLEGKKAGLHSILSRISQGSMASIHLHEALHYKHVGVLKEVGRKFGNLLDVYMMQIVFNSED